MLDSTLTTAFWAFVAERHRVWYRRYVQQRPWPWSTDPVIREAHLTNVYRDLDPGTQVALEGLRAAPSQQDAVMFSVAYRCVNLRTTLVRYRERCGPGPYIEGRHAWCALLDELHEQKVTVRTARHLTPGRKLGKAALETIAVPGFNLGRGSFAAWQALRAVPGLGTFTAWQVYADLASAGWIVELDPRFVRVGAAFALTVLERGPSRLLEYHHDGSTQRQGGGRVRPGKREQDRLGSLLVEELHARQLERLPAGFFTVPPARPLAVWDVEHALCEWLRYELLRSGVRELKRQYRYYPEDTR